MSLLSVKHLFGIQSYLTDSVAYLDEHSYLYPTSRNIILYNIDNKCQSLINFDNEHDVLESLCVSPNKQYIAIGFNTLDKSRIIIYETNETIKNEFRRRKTLTLRQKLHSNHILSICFSANSKYLLTLHDAPNYILVMWSIERHKPITMISLHFLHINLLHNPLNIKISFNPINSFEFLITGNHIYRRYHFNKGHFSSSNFDQYRQCELMNITCHCWLNKNHVLLGLDTGYIYIVNNHGNIIQRYDVTQTRTNQINQLNIRSSNIFSTDQFHGRTQSDTIIKKKKKLLKIKSSCYLSSNFEKKRRSLSRINYKKDEINHQSCSQHSDKSLHNKISQTELMNANYVICLLPFSRGLFVSIGRGYVIMYERNENSIELTYLRRLILPSYNINDFSLKKTKFNLNHRTELKGNLSLKSFEKESLRNLSAYDSAFTNQRSISNEIILSLALSPNEETLLSATNVNHLYEISFSKMDYVNKDETLFTYALDSLSRGTIIITGLISIWKPILYTLATDQSIQIWNLNSNKLEFYYKFDIEPVSLSIHPNGIFICVSFSSTIRIYVYNLDGLYLFKEIELSNIRCIEYSHQGHILAVAYDNILEFRHHNDYSLTINVKENDKKIRLIRWSYGDSFVISVDFDDLIIRWDPCTGQNLFQYQIFDFQIEDLVISSDNKFAYLLTREKQIKEFQLMMSIRDINIPFDNCIPTALVISDETKNLFIGSQIGSIYSIKLTDLNAIHENNKIYNVLYENIHQGAVTKVLISDNNDLMVSIGEDGNIISYNLNNYQKNKESRIIFRDETLVKKNLLREQNLELNHLINHEFEIINECNNKFEIKNKEHIEHVYQIDIYYQTHINNMENKLKELNQYKYNLKIEYKHKLQKLIEDKQYLFNQFNQNKNRSYENILTDKYLLNNNVEYLNINQNKNFESIYHSSKHYVQLIYLSYRDEMNNIKKRFLQENLDLNQRINYLEEVKYSYDEDFQIERNYSDQYYIGRITITLDKIQKLENEQILLKIRLEQFEQESNHFQDQMKKINIERNKILDRIRQNDNDFNLVKQTIQQRNLIIQEKLKHTNQMEHRKDELEKFIYVFNYKIRELNNEIGPRQHEVEALIEQFHNMDNEYDLLNQNNEKYSIKIADRQARLRATEKELQCEITTIRKLNETVANINEDLKFCCHLIDKPNQLIKFIRHIYEKHLLHLYTHIDLSQMNSFDFVRQRAYFEQNNQRLIKKISFDVKQEKVLQAQRIQEQISMMREISYYCLKVVEVERILSDLDIVLNVALKMNATSSNEIIHALKIEQGSNFIEKKQTEINSIINQQEKRIEQFRDSIEILEENLRQTSKHFQLELTFNINYSTN